MMFSPLWLQRVYHVVSFLAVMIWAPWWVAVPWFVLLIGSHCDVDPKRAELLLTFIPRDRAISRDELVTRVAAAHGRPLLGSVDLFFALHALRRRGLIEQFDEPFCPPHAAEVEWIARFRRLV